MFTTRSPDRPNPLGLHRVRVLAFDGNKIVEVYGLEAVDGTPVVDLKPLLGPGSMSGDSRTGPGSRRRNRSAVDP